MCGLTIFLMNVSFSVMVLAFCCSNSLMCQNASACDGDEDRLEDKSIFILDCHFLTFFWFAQFGYLYLFIFQCNSEAE
jgi:hypothetical protein